jgi:hypothetical protein
MTSAFDLEACSRLPVADASLRLLEYTLDTEFLTSVFEQHRDRSYEKEISFPNFVQIISDALLGHRGSAHQTFRKAQEEGTLEITLQATYGKLRRVPIPLSLGFFDEATQRLNEVAIVLPDALPQSLVEFRALAFDGKKLKYVLKRLKPLRGLKGNVYGGKLLSVQDMATGQAIAVEGVADGEAADNPLVAGVVARVRLQPDTQPRLWVGDRAFCEFKCLHLLSKGDDHFLIRYNARCGFHPDESKPIRQGIDDENRHFQEQWGWLGTGKTRVEVRLITVTRPKGDPLRIVTSLLDADLYPAFDLLILYRKRWGIETMFQHVVQTFDLRHLISGTPQGTVFQAVFCLLLYNITRLVRDYVAVGAKCSPETISLKVLFKDMVDELTAWMKVIGPAQTPTVLADRPFCSPNDFKRYLRKTLGSIWTDRWEKAPTYKRPPKEPPRAYLGGGHSSVDKILRGEHTEIPIKAKKKSAA